MRLEVDGRSRRHERHLLPRHAGVARAGAAPSKTLIWNKDFKRYPMFPALARLSISSNNRIGEYRGIAVHIHARMMVREMGAAFALLSLYVLILFAPLHQAAGLQRDLDALGYASLEVWSICQPLTVDGSRDQVEVSKCPLAGVGKHEVALATPPSIDLAAPSISTPVFYPIETSTGRLPRPPFVGQARAPPVTV